MDETPLQLTAGSQVGSEVTLVTLLGEEEHPTGEDHPNGQDGTTAPSSSVTETPHQKKREWHIKTICVIVFVVALVLISAISVPLLSAFLFGKAFILSFGPENATNGSNVTVVCREDFYLGDDGLCRPECTQFEYFPHRVENALHIVRITFFATGITAALVVITVSCIRRKRLLKFPSIFIVYQTVSMLLFDIILLVGQIDTDKLFCSSSDLEESFNNPTAFCTLSGMVLYYTVLQMLLWLLFHLASLFWSLKFPFHIRSYQSNHRTRYILVAMTTAGLLVPLVPALVPLGGKGYISSVRIPPISCVALSDNNIYTLYLPAAAIGASVLCLLVGIFWRIIKQRRLRRSKESNASLTVPEIKVLFLITYFLIAGAVVVVAGSVLFFNVQKANRALDSFLSCESMGVIPGTECDKSEFGREYLDYLESS